MLKNLDLYGANLHFKVNNQTKIRTSLGGIFFLIINFLFVLLVYAFGQDFFNRLNPMVTKSQFTPDEMKPYNISNENYQVMFRIENDSYDAIDTEGNSFFFSAIHVFTNYSETNVTLQKRTTLLPVLPCNKINMPNFSQEEITEKGYDKWKCLHINSQSPIKNLLLGGSIDNGLHGEIKINLHKCEEGSFNLFTRKPCNTEEKTKDYLWNITWYAIMFQKTVFTPSSYDKPLKQEMARYINILNDHLLKGYKVYFQLSEVFSDVGWIIESESYHHSFGLSEIIPDYMLRERTGKAKDLLSIVQLNLSTETIHYKRTYEKIQNLAANIGGILKIFTVVAGTIVNIYNSSTFEYSFSNNLVDKTSKNKKSIYNNPVDFNVLAPVFNSNQKVINNINKLNPNKQKTGEYNIHDDLNNNSNVMLNQKNNNPDSKLNNKSNFNETKDNFNNDMSNIKNNNYIDNTNNNDVNKSSKLKNNFIEELNKCKEFIVKINNLNNFAKNGKKCEFNNNSTNNIKNDYNKLNSNISNFEKDSLDKVKNNNKNKEFKKYNYFGYLFFIVSHLRYVKIAEYKLYLKIYNKYANIVDYQNIVKTSLISRIIIDNLFSQNEIENIINLF